MARELKRYLEIGQIVGAHGIKGEMRVFPWCDSPDYLTKFKKLYFDINGRQSAAIERCRPHGNITILKLEGIEDINSVLLKRGKTLFADRNDVELPEGDYYFQDLIGCVVIDYESGKEYGLLSNISKTGANDVWHIEDENKKEYLIPAIKDVVKHIDIIGGLVKISPLKGIFNDAD